METVGAFLAFLLAVFFRNLFALGARALTGYMGRLAMGVFHGMVSLMPDQAWRMFDAITETFFVQPEEWAPFVASWLQNMTGEEIDPATIAGIPIKDMGATAAEVLGETFLTPMLGMIMPDAQTDWTVGGLPPEEGLNGAERFLGVNLSFQMQAWLLHLLGDTISFGMWKSLKDLPNAINWSYGLGWLSWLVMGVPFRMAISDPLEMLYNNLYRPWRPSFAYLAKAFWREEITGDQYRTALRHLGVSEEWLPIVIEMERETFSITEIRDLYHSGYLSADAVVWAMRDRGNSPADAEALGTLLINERVRDTHVDIGQEGMALYIDGILSWTEASGYLALAGYTGQEIETLHVLADLKMQRKTEKQPTDKELTAANIGRLYQLGEYTSPQAQSALAALPFKAAQIADFLKLYTPPEPKVEEPPDLTRSAIGTMWKRQQITTDQAEILWQGLGYTAETIFYWFQYYSPQVPWPPPPPAPPELTASRIGAIYREGGMERDAALDRMEALGWDRGEAALILDYIYPPPDPTVEPELRLPRGTVGTLYREGIITREGAIGMWQELGYTASSAELLATLYEPAPEVPPPVIPPRELSTAQIGSLYRMGAITLVDGIERLERLGYRADDAETVLVNIYPPPEPPIEPTLRLPRETIGGLYREGIIVEEDARAMWTEQGYEPPTVELLVRYYQPPPAIEPPEIPPTEFSTSQVGQLYREGALSLQEAIARLVRINYTEPDAQLLLSTLYGPAEPPVAEERLLGRGTIGTLYREGIIDQGTARGLFLAIPYSVEVTSWLLALYAPPPEIPPPVLPPEEFSVSQVGRLYQVAALSLEESVERLERLRWRTEDAELLLAYLYPPPDPVVAEERLLTKSDIAALYTSSVITEETFTLMMVALGYPEDVVVLLERLYRPTMPAPKPPAELNPSTVGRLWQSRTIDLAEALDRLARVLIPEDNALLLLTLYVWDPLLVQTGQALAAEEISRSDAEVILFDRGMTFDDIQLWLRLWV